MHRSREVPLPLMVAVSFIALAPVTSSCSSPSSGPTSADQGQARADAAALIDEGYALKQSGKNRAALTRFEKACAGLEQAGLGRSAEYASCLDDRGSVLVRIGEYEQAEERYYYALRTATAAEGADPRLVTGIRYRIGLLGRLQQLGIRCAEPDAPPPDAALPYFPDVTEMQRALGALGPRVHSCASGPPRPVTLKVTITGDGRPIMAETRGAESGTDVGKCVERRITEAIPGAGAELPGFRACFRAFTYPFPVGDVPPSKPVPAAANQPADSAP